MVFDVLIVGAGVVGLSLALDLAQAGLKVALLEKQNCDRFNNTLDLSQYDTRVFAINWASQALFESLGVWDAIEAYRVSPYESMKVWDSFGQGYIHFDSESILESQLGHIIEQKVLLKALWDKAKEFENIEMIASCELMNLTVNSSVSNLYTDKGRFQAHLIVGADGAHSWVRSQAGFKVKGWSYEQSALVATISHEKSHEKTARQRFAPDGPLALLPLKDDYTSSIVWMTTPVQAEHLKNLSDSKFSDILTQRFGPTLGTLSLAEENRALFPLKMQQVVEYCQPGCALVGDAAQTIHPLAGLGMNLGLNNVKTLADLIKIQKQKRRGLGDIGYLKRYERREKLRASLVIAAMEGFKRGFGTDNKVIAYLRNTGLNWVDRHSLIKKRFMHFAMGK